jgi:hypothetical protein
VTRRVATRIGERGKQGLRVQSRNRKAIAARVWEDQLHSYWSVDGKSTCNRKKSAGVSAGSTKRILGDGRILTMEPVKRHGCSNAFPSSSRRCPAMNANAPVDSSSREPDVQVQTSLLHDMQRSSAQRYPRIATRTFMCC